MPTEAIQISKKEYGKTSCQGTCSYVSQSFHAKEKAKKEEELKRKKKKKKKIKPISVTERKKKEIEKLNAVFGAFYAFYLFLNRKVTLDAILSINLISIKP